MSVFGAFKIPSFNTDETTLGGVLTFEVFGVINFRKVGLKKRSERSLL